MTLELDVGDVLAVLLWLETPGSEDEVRVFAGPLKRRNGTYSVDRGSEPPFVLQADWLPRIRLAPPDVADIVRPAKYLLSLSVGKLEGDYKGPLMPTGLNLPRDAV